MIREAILSDLDCLEQLLHANHLRAEGILEDQTRYWVACKDSAIIGAIGVELGTECALLRSAVVVPTERGRGVGRRLTEHALDWAWQNGYRTVYCFSTDARSYWAARGFEECPVEEVVGELPHAPQVRLFEALGWLPTEIALRKVCDGSISEPCRPPV
ncbi:MAG TPA: GNAT family N-acetyltransferase [Bryobacteraceae bacterium]|nr:GNAT family N-acetyltransferase [Bryobacteraceae bacterium]